MQKENIFYKYKTISVDHLEELQEDINKLYRENKLSDNEIYRSYLKTKKFEIPETLPDAKFIIILAIFTKLGFINMYLDGKKHRFMIPPQYYDDGLTLEDLDYLVKNEIIKEPGYNVEMKSSMHLKLLAVRSGLGKYGRNNICYVEDMGSFISLYAFFTDFKFEEDNWNEIQLMEQCESCTICMENCPNQCIRESNFVINAGRCLPLYNEIRGEFPDWLDNNAHNALMGCMRCQLPCPADQEVIKNPINLEDISEEETKMLLSGETDEKLLDSLCSKLKMFTPSNSDIMLPVVQRNLKALLSK
jgi:epoxyqueuosine reductase